MEEIKNNEFDKLIKEKDFYKTYINSLQKRPNSFKQENYNNRNDGFTPNIYKHPENIYLRAIYDYQNSKEKMKNYNKKTGQFDLYLNRNRTNKIYINAENKNVDNLNKNNNDNNNNILKTSLSNINTKNNNNQFKKKNLCLNVGRGNLTKNNYPSKKPSYNTFLTNNSSNLKKNKSKNCSQDNSNKKPNNFDDNREITIDEMMNFLIDKEKEKEKEKKKQKKINLTNLNSAVNHKKNSQQNNKMKMSLNDPLNPYSALFYNNILFTNYNVKMHYKQMQMGVPYLRTRKIKTTDLPPLTQGNNIIEETNFCNTSSSGLKKKKIILLPKSETNNKNISKKQSDENNGNENENIDKNYNDNENKDIKNEIKDNNDNEKKEKKIETKILFQSNGDNNDFVNEEFEFNKEDADINNNDEIKNEKKEKKRLSGIIEEEN